MGWKLVLSTLDYVLGEIAGGEARGRGGLRAMSKRELKSWMRLEQAFIWIAAIAVSLMAAGAIAYRPIS
jgi:hypothetical protein